MSRSPGAERDQEALSQYVASWQGIFRLMREGHSWSGRERNQVFLNCGFGDAGAGPGQASRFADVSAVTGLDFADDGRALAMADWDHDGDLDLWLHNRTGPRLRLMLNQTDPRQSAGASSVALRLRGVTANRDGVGARVEVVLSGDGPGERRVQTVYAGDGYQSQSSLWLHFGLGELAGRTIERVVVNWPVPGDLTATAETFTGVAPDGRYLLAEGAGKAQLLSPRDAVRLEASEQRLPETSSDARLFLPHRLPLPELPYRPLDGGGDSATAGITSADPNAATVGELVTSHGGPVLVNLWASWCLPCLAEFRELAEHRTELDAAGLEILALTVEDLDQKDTGVDDASKVLRGLGFSGPSGAATAELLDKLDVLEEVLYEIDPPFVVPMSYLLDRQGRLAAVYRGRLDLAELLADVRLLEATPSALHRRSAQLPGRWHAQVPSPDLFMVGQIFRDRYPADMERYLLAAVQRFDKVVQNAESEDIAAHASDRASSAWIELAEASKARGDSGEAMGRLREALHRRGDSTLAHIKLGELLRDAGQNEESLQHFGLAYQSDPENAVARYGLGIAFYALGDLDNALGHLNAARHYAPDMPAPLQGIAWILIRHADPRDERATRDALDMAQTGVELTQRRDARMLDVLAAAQARAGRFDEARSTAREALDVARATEDGEWVAEIESRLAAYEAGRMPEER